MCGIVGIIGVRPTLTETTLDGMLSSMHHRGPNDRGSIQLNDFPGQSHALLHTRLAVIDPSSAGHQPMQNKLPSGKSHWIAFNGEVYNYAEIRQSLEADGFSFETNCDTEVVLKSYLKWGEDCLQHFRGMFAFVLADPEKQRIWVVRDRLGIKPVYYYRPESGGMLLASEIRTLLAAGPSLVKPILNPNALETYLAHGSVWGSDSIIKGIQLLEPAHTLTLDWKGNILQKKRYWGALDLGTLPYCSASSRSQAVEEVAHEIRESVRLRLISDVPLGLFLSGGIDSSAIATVATEVCKESVQTLTIGFDIAQFDETEAASQIASALGTEHRTLKLTGQNILTDWNDVLSSMDQPTVDGFNSFFVSRAARQAGLTVALSGLGGDELFGGYPSFAQLPKILPYAPFIRLFSWIDPLLRRSGLLTRSRVLTKLRELARRKPDLVSLYLLRREFLLPDERRLLLKLPKGSQPDHGLPASLIESLGSIPKGADLFTLISKLELSLYTRDMLLRDTDVFSMANSLEVRVPLLDHKLVETVLSLPGKWKSHGQCAKPLLVEAIGNRLPHICYTSPKQGFSFPWDEWLRGPLKSNAEKGMGNEDAWHSIGIDSQAVRHLWNLYLDKDRRVDSHEVLGLLILSDFVQKHGLRLEEELLPLTKTQQVAVG